MRKKPVQIFIKKDEKPSVLTSTERKRDRINLINKLFYLRLDLIHEV